MMSVLFPSTDIFCFSSYRVLQVDHATCNELKFRQNKVKDQRINTFLCVAGLLNKRKSAMRILCVT